MMNALNKYTLATTAITAVSSYAGYLNFVQPLVVGAVTLLGTGILGVGGYKAACNIYQREYEGLENYLINKWDFSPERALDLANTVKTVAATAVFVACLAPLTYTVYGLKG